MIPRSLFVRVLRIPALFLLLSGLLGPCLSASAQGAAVPRAYIPPLSLGINLDVGFPMQALRDNLDQTGVGASITFLAALRKLPLRFGLNAGYMGYDSQSLFYRTVVGGFLRDYLLETNVGLLHGHVHMRYMLPLAGKVNPYVEGVAGFKYFFTTSQLYEDFGFELVLVDGFTGQDDFVLSYGAGAGLELRVFRDPSFGIDLGVTYMLGSQATYLVRRNPPPSNLQDPSDLFEERSSTTPLLVPRIGLQFDLTRQGREEAPAGRDRRRRR